MSARFLLALPAVAAGTAPAFAIAVFDRPALSPEHAYVGSWNGASAVAVGQRFVLTAAHNRGSLRDTFTLAGQDYHALSIHRHASADLMLVELAEDLPGFHRLAASPAAAGDQVLLAGAGLTASASGGLSPAEWSGRRELQWGTNTLDAAGGRYLTISFDAHSLATEAIFTRFDSGGGLFVRNADGSLALAGMAIGASSTDGATSIGDVARALRLDRFERWLDGFDLEGLGGTAVEPAPVPGLLERVIPAPAAWAVAAPAGLLALRRRR